MKNNPSNTLFKWLQENLGKSCLAPLTGSDSAALKAAVLVVETWCYSDSAQRPHCLTAFREIVMVMQPKCRELAYHAIAHVHEWSTRATFWRDADLGAGFDRGFTPRLCRWEPGGAARNIS